jgi:hypothetical protein
MAMHRNIEKPKCDIWSQLASAVDLADMYNTFVFDDSVEEGAAGAGSKADDIYNKFKDTIDSDLLQALLDNEQLRYVLQPIKHESAKRLPHLTYAWNVQTIVQDIMCISNKFGASATFKTDLVNHRNALREFFGGSTGDGDIALLLADNIPILRNACGGMGSGLCDIRTQQEDFIPKDCHTVVAVVPAKTTDTGKHHEAVLCAKSLNDSKSPTDDLKSYSFYIPKTASESRGTLYRNVELFVIGTSNAITFAKCMLEDVPCVLVNGAETILYKPISILETETKRLKQFITSVHLLKGSKSLLASAQQRLLGKLDACCAGIVKHAKKKKVSSRIELLILVDALQAIRKKLVFIFENLDVNDILSCGGGYLPLEEDEQEKLVKHGKTTLELLQGFNNTNLRFLRRLINLLSSDHDGTAAAVQFDKSVADKLQEEYVENVILPMTNNNKMVPPKRMLSCSFARKVDTPFPCKHLETAEMFFDLFGMNPELARKISQSSQSSTEASEAHAYYRYMCNLSNQLSVADENVTNLELFDGKYKANHEEYFMIWNDLAYFTKHSPLNVVSCEAAVRNKPKVSVRGLKHAYDTCKKYEVVAQSNYLHEVSAIIESLQSNDRLLDALTKRLERAAISMHLPDDGRNTFMSTSFKANALIEEALQLFVAQIKDRLVQVKYTGIDSLWQAFNELKDFISSDEDYKISNKTSGLQKLCNSLLQSDQHDSNISTASIALHNFLQHESHCMNDFQERIMMLASFSKLMMMMKPEAGIIKMEGGGGDVVGKMESSTSDKLRAYVVKLMNSKTEVILQCTFVVFLFVISNGIYRYYELGGSASSASSATSASSTKELMKQILMNTVLMAVLANLANHVEVELCVYTIYFAYIGMAIMRLLKTS